MDHIFKGEISQNHAFSYQLQNLLPKMTSCVQRITYERKKGRRGREREKGELERVKMRRDNNTGLFLSF